MPNSFQSRLHRRLRRTARGVGLAGPPLGHAPVILLYHRVADPPCDPWDLAVSPARFREQLEMLNATRTVLAMDELVAALEAGDAPPGAAAVTFDDGYADNASVAKPILENLGVPATVFLATGAVTDGRPFWWDELAALLFGSEGSGAFELELGPEPVRIDWGADRASADALRRWRADEPAPESRCRAYVELWRVLQRLGAAERNAAVAAVREQLRPAAPIDAGRPMSAAEARSLASGLIAVGGHARSHVPLPALDPARRREEIAGGRDDVARLTGGKAPAGFAYPHGAWDAATRDEVAAAGYSWAAAVGFACVDPRRFDRFALPRLPAGNRTGTELERAIRQADR